MVTTESRNAKFSDSAFLIPATKPLVHSHLSVASFSLYGLLIGLKKKENLILFFFTFTYNEHIIHGHPFSSSYDSVSVRPQCLHTIKWFQRSNHWQEWGVGGCKVLEQDHRAQQDHGKDNSGWLETRLTFWSLNKTLWG